MLAHFIISIKFVRRTGPRPFRHGYCFRNYCLDSISNVSIGPRLFSHGYGTTKVVACLQPKMFQLGHDFSAMDTPREYGGVKNNKVSIGPRLFSHGYGSGDGSSVADFIVSIGPRLFSHGYIIRR